MNRDYVLYKRRGGYNSIRVQINYSEKSSLGFIEWKTEEEECPADIVYFTVSTSWMILKNDDRLSRLHGEELVTG